MADGLDVVAVGILHEPTVVVGMIGGPEAGPAIVLAACGQSGRGRNQTNHAEYRNLLGDRARPDRAGQRSRLTRAHLGRPIRLTPPSSTTFVSRQSIVLDDKTIRKIPLTTQSATVESVKHCRSLHRRVE